METITIDGMDEHDFRYAIEDMLRLDQVDEAIARLRVLLEPYAGPGGLLPSRFLEVTSDDVEFAGWHKLASRLHHHDRPSFPISAIGVALADARTLGGPGPASGRLAPFIKTFYFSDDAYPFTGATRDDLLDGYSREGFGWQSDYQATDATLSVKGIDDLHGAIIELEERLFDKTAPSDDEIRAGSIGACYLAALIHRALREAIRKNGLPRPLCVLAACDGVYPFFDAPVAGRDEAPADTDEWPNELEGAVPAEGNPQEDGEDGEPAEDIPGEASLLSLVHHLTAKKPVMVLAEDEMREAANFTEMAAAQRMVFDEDHPLRGILQGLPMAEPARPRPDETPDAALDEAQSFALFQNDIAAAEAHDLTGSDEDLLPPPAGAAEDLAAVADTGSTDPDADYAPVFEYPYPAASNGFQDPVTLLSGSRLRARIIQPVPERQAPDRPSLQAVAAWVRRLAARLRARFG